jgi:hypothetical protein
VAVVHRFDCISITITQGTSKNEKMFNTDIKSLNIILTIGTWKVHLTIINFGTHLPKGAR